MSALSNTTLVIVPCYNEEKRLDSAAFLDFCDSNSEFHFLFVNDGSTDNTQKIINAICSKWGTQTSALELKSNVGKAHAVQAGLRQIRLNEYHSFGYLDADLSAPLSSLLKLKKAIQSNNDKQAAFGSRIKLLGNQIERSEFRHYFSRLFVSLSNLILGLKIYDSQCGMKIFSSSCITQLTEKDFVSKWFFDLEIVMRLGEDKIIEVPLDVWISKEGSKLIWKDYFLSFLEIMKISKTYKRTRN